MKNKIVLSYRFIILVYYLLAFLIVIININHLERVLIYSLILIVLFGIVVHIYILNIPKLLLSNKYIEKNLSTVKEAIDKIHNKSINDSLITIYIFLLEISNYKEEYQNFVEQNSKRIFDEKQNRHWYTIKLQYYYNLNKKDEYLKLYDPQLDNKVKNPLFKIMYLILNEEYTFFVQEEYYLLYLDTISFIVSHFFSISATNFNCVLQRSKLCSGYFILKYVSPCK